MSRLKCEIGDVFVGAVLGVCIVCREPRPVCDSDSLGPSFQGPLLNLITAPRVLRPYGLSLDQGQGQTLYIDLVPFNAELHLQYTDRTPRHTCKALSGRGAMSGLPPETYAGASSCHHQCEGGTLEPCVRSCTAVTERSHPSSWKLLTEASALHSTQQQVSKCALRKVSRTTVSGK